MTRKGLLAVVALIAQAAPTLAQDVAVDVELVLAVDISGSVDPTEAEQQRRGYVEAIAHPDVIRAITASGTGRVALAYVEWAGATTQDVVVPWRVIDSEESARAFAGELAEAPMRRAMWTSISAALDFVVPMFEGNGIEGDRRVIDVSGDGVNNRGRPIVLARQAALDAGITINGLPILNDRPQPYAMPTPMDVELDRYYAENVVGGPGSFIVPALSFEEFREAILQKLILEIAGKVPERRLAAR